jgi:hypothetical protein
LYTQSIPSQVVSPVAPSKTIYSSTANLHAVSPAKQPLQSTHIGSPQPVKHNRSLSSKQVEPNLVGSERERSNSIVKFNYASIMGTGTTSNVSSNILNQPVANSVSRGRTNSGLASPLATATTEQTNKDSLHNTGMWQKSTNYQPSTNSFFSQSNQAQNINITTANSNTLAAITTGFSNQNYTSGNTSIN